MIYHGTYHKSLVFSQHTQSLGECINQECKSDKWDVPMYSTRKRCITILYHAIKNTVANTVKAEHNGNVGCHTVEYTTAFLYSDWLYFLWHGIKYGIKTRCPPY